MSDLKIAAVQSFLTQPQKARLIVVKVLTSEPGLYGLGCATFTQRHGAVEAALRHHIGPFAIGKDPRNTEDLWHAMMVNAFWRNGPVLNNAISGVDMALWDIKGKLAGMPCYDLWGGRCRPAAAVYVHCNGTTPEALLDAARQRMADGYQHIRCQLGGYPGTEASDQPPRPGMPPGEYFDPKERLRTLPALFERLRRELGDRVELLHDVHERLAPIDAVWLAKALEPYRLFFLEDVLAPEDLEWFENIRAVCATPLAMGELFNHPREITPLVARRLIDFIRVHPSQLGGITPCLKLAHLCEAFGVRTAWHGPGDLSPVGVAANVHLDLALHNFGIQEWSFPNQATHDMFPGLPEARAGYAWASDGPGLGVEFDEALAAKFPCDDANPTWTVARLPDGTIGRP
ncbi:MAG TPA: enolase C-terminal domain-like protein [Planctomycetota bacterium]|nr:enolase C-terminal domain-like protein [Planctomycetota bacterium]